MSKKSISSNLAIYIWLPLLFLLVGCNNINYTNDNSYTTQTDRAAVAIQEHFDNLQEQSGITIRPETTQLIRERANEVRQAQLQANPPELSFYVHAPAILSIENELDLFGNAIADHLTHLSKQLDRVVSIDEVIYDPPYQFSWLDFITKAQFEIAKEYLRKNITDIMSQIGAFVPNELFYMTSDTFLFSDDMPRFFGMSLNVSRTPQNPTNWLQSYDRTPFDEMSDNPRRILVRMYEAWWLVLLTMDLEYSE